MDSFLSAADISASGMAAERLRMQIIANNVANANTTNTPQGGPYRRLNITFAPILNNKLSRRGGGGASGVEVVGVEPDMGELPKIFDEHHPDADEQGYVHLPNVSIAREMVDMITSTRSYEANLQSLKNLRSMVEQSLALLRST
ncbi:MAG: flagellar basal body rod protein FlgC [Planctomycetota bacterium]